MNVRTPAKRGYTLASMGLYLDPLTALENTSSIPRRPTAEATARLLRARGLCWATALDAATHEVHGLDGIREWGSDE